MTGEKHEISSDSELSLKREMYFSKEKIIREIVAIAQTGGIESGDLQLEPETEKYDGEGNLLFLSIKVRQERAREKKCGNIWYFYMVKGEHGPMGASRATLIMKADSKIETPDEVDWAEIVLEYREAEDKWITS